LLKRLPDASTDTISSLINSISGVIPDWGTAERTAINDAYSDVMRRMTLVALIVSGISFLCVTFMPDNRLVDAQNLVEADEAKEVQPKLSDDVESKE
jgi:hypothetical protein